MAEPVTTTTAAISFGLTALLAGWVGQIEAEVMIVVLSAIAGSMVALSSKKKSFIESLKFIFLGVIVSTVLAWAISSMIINHYPAMASPYLPTMVSFILGFIVDKIPTILDLVVDKIVKKA